MHKVPPTFLQAMHRASAELGQALKSPEKATVAPEGDHLPGSSWSLFFHVDLRKGDLAFAAQQEREQAQVKRGHLTDTTLNWGVK